LKSSSQSLRTGRKSALDRSAATLASASRSSATEALARTHLTSTWRWRRSRVAAMKATKSVQRPTLTIRRLPSTRRRKLLSKNPSSSPPLPGLRQAFLQCGLEQFKHTPHLSLADTLPL